MVGGPIIGAAFSVGTQMVQNYVNNQPLTANLNPTEIVLVRRKQAEVDLAVDGFDDISYHAIPQLSTRRLRTGDRVIDLTHAAEGEERM